MSAASWLATLQTALARKGALLDPDFAAVVAKAVVRSGASMPEIVDALNKCHGMAHKSRLLAHKGVNAKKSGKESGIEAAREVLQQSLDALATEELDEEEVPDGDEGAG